MKLILDYTAYAKKNKEWLANPNYPDNDPDYIPVAEARENNTVLTLYYPDGKKEHFATTETHPNVRQGRRAAKRALRRHCFVFEDRTK